MLSKFLTMAQSTPDIVEFPLFSRAPRMLGNVPDIVEFPLAPRSSSMDVHGNVRSPDLVEFPLESRSLLTDVHGTVPSPDIVEFPLVPRSPRMDVCGWREPGNVPGSAASTFVPPNMTSLTLQEMYDSQVHGDFPQVKETISKALKQLRACDATRDNYQKMLRMVHAEFEFAETISGIVPRDQSFDAPELAEFSSVVDNIYSALKNLKQADITQLNYESVQRIVNNAFYKVIDYSGYDIARSLPLIPWLPTINEKLPIGKKDRILELIITGFILVSLFTIFLFMELSYNTHQNQPTWNDTINPNNTPHALPSHPQFYI